MVMFKGVAPKPQNEEASNLNLEANFRFVYRTHPRRWTLYGDRLLPVLHQKKLEPGIDNVDTKGDYAIAKAIDEKKGWKYLDEKNGPHDPDSGRNSYIRCYQGRNGPVYLSAWEEPKKVGGEIKIKSNVDAYLEWVEELVKENVIDQIDPDVLDDMIDFHMKKIDDFGLKDVSKPMNKRMLDKAEKDLETLNAIKEALYGEAA